ncbi:DUF3710 domain-containing protein [Nocardioides aequoreus]|uniref:DUF3710 domain-containing protein n=1 Tax=Nocardioides aequoreus TaxID=397278 RepID=UPI00068ACAC7|nr:DUF3710 domain-containing protein [Nocardioides aequoreus]
MRFGRKKRAGEVEDTAEVGVGDTAADAATEEVAADEVAPPARSRDLPETGPFDVAEVDVEEGDWVDLGSLLFPPPTDAELRLQVDESTGEVMSVLLVGGTGALELRAFAASRGGGAWEELRPRLAAEVGRQGGTATEEQGAFGTELVARVPVTGPDGEPATQASRFAGHEGPTWLLRTNVMGRPAVDAEQAGPWESFIRSVVVRRGAGAMPPGTPLPLTLPPDARRVDGADGEGEAADGPEDGAADRPPAP